MPSGADSGKENEPPSKRRKNKISELHDAMNEQYNDDKKQLDQLMQRDEERFRANTQQNEKVLSGLDRLAALMEKGIESQAADRALILGFAAGRNNV